MRFFWRRKKNTRHISPNNDKMFYTDNATGVRRFPRLRLNDKIKKKKNGRVNNLTAPTYQKKSQSICFKAKEHAPPLTVESVTKASFIHMN